jgi:CP family cyanate transporter-like MFS transporter
VTAPVDVAAPSRREEPVARGSLAPVVVAVVLFAINLRTIVASLPPLLDEVRTDLGLSGAVAGLLTTLPVMCFGALAPLAPRLARRFSLERLLVACAVITTVAAALRGAGGPVALFGGSLLAGVGVAVAQCTLPVLIRVRHPRQTGLLTGAYSMALPLGATLAAAVAVPLERTFDGSWRASLAIWAIPAALAVLVWLPAALRPGTFVGGPQAARLRSEPLAWWVALFMGVQSMTFYAGLAWLPTILEASGFTNGQAGTLQALNSLVSLVPAFLVPVLAARRPSQTGVLIVIVVIAAVGITGLLVAPRVAPLWMALIGMGQGGMLGLGLILPVLRAGSARAVASLTGMSLCVGYLVASTGPWLLGAVHDATGDWTAPLLVLLAITFLMLVPGLPAARARTIGSGGVSA